MARKEELFKGLVNINPDSQSNLDAHLMLAATVNNRFFKKKKGFRKPLGIYNISINRICDRVIRLCARLENLFQIPLNALKNDVVQELVDYIELSIYAAAEHVDDVNLIASMFLNNSTEEAAKKEFRKLKEKIKNNKRLISTVANQIKHQQARIRIFSTKFQYSGITGCLHGYFVEGVEDGVVGPNMTFHSEQQIFSVTTITWEILIFILNCSRNLAHFIEMETGVTKKMEDTHCEIFNKAIVAAARLPNYAFGDEHPFFRSAVHLTNVASYHSLLDSGLYGSLLSEWPKKGSPIFSPTEHSYEGDGVSKEFKIINPKQVKFHRWD